VVERRTKLLDRLEEEKLQARAIPHSTAATAEPVVALDRISQGHGLHPIVFPPDVTLPPMDVTEARLRKQAQLRVRLAAEKRDHARGR